MAKTNDNTRPEILVVGAGPVGLVLSGELARHGVRCRIIDGMAEPSPYCRAIGITPRSLAIFREMGIERAFLDAGIWLEGTRIITGGASKDLPSQTADRSLGLPQYDTERFLTQHLSEFDLSVERGTRLTDVANDGDGVRVTLTDAGGRAVEAAYRYVIGCDGAHSDVRRACDIAFEGDSFPFDFMLGDVQADLGLPRGWAARAIRPRTDAPPDMFIAIPLPEAGRYRVSMVAPPKFSRAGREATDHGLQAAAPRPELADLQAVADDLLPNQATLSDLRWSSVYRISMRLAARYRVGRVFIAGDAAHVHPPTGGLGMNNGIEDAYVLAKYLAAVMNGKADESSLDGYEAERRPVAAEVIQKTLQASLNLAGSK